MSQPSRPQPSILLAPTDQSIFAEDRKQSMQRWVGILLVILITVAGFWLAFNPEWTRWIGQWGYVGAFLISMIASATIILPAPGIAVVIAMGSALDPYILGIVAGIGSAVGELTGYVAGRTGRALIPEDQRHYFEWIQRHTKSYGSLLLLGLAAIPFPLFDLAGIVAGVLRMRLWAFLTSVSIGKSLKYIILILVGSGAVELLQQLWR